jgi:hypothetical protein
MKPIEYRTGNAAAPQAAGPKIVAHVCNDQGQWGKGFVLAVSCLGCQQGRTCPVSAAWDLIEPLCAKDIPVTVYDFR